ncbi:MAG: HEAT repeat domain-containing protein [Gemmataceae bacterium]|nr:HEAT repeat domain-containing protein [Gemmataceae bacterium]
MSRLVRLAAVPLFASAALVAAAVPPEEQQGKGPAKGSAEEALAQVQVEKGLTVEVWAAEPLMANPVAFGFDEKGRAYVAETTRFSNGVPDTRGHMKWLDEDLANRSTADRLAMYQKHRYEGFEKYDDQVRLLWDSSGKGRADKATVFSKGYNRPEDGLIAGVLARKGRLYVGCIPDLYVVKDTNDDGAADEKQSLFTGFGPTAQFLGHDLHGLRMGPDGKLYFSVGDRGFVVRTKEGHTLSYPNTGAVLRCEPHGRNLEVVHYGLRNPQELAFDDFGNLFTYDNNSDSGDKARWVQIVEGGDSGWRGGYQYGTLYHPPGVKEGNRGPWNGEGIWHLPGQDGDGPPAHVVPPLAHFGNGPAGITHYPGVGLNDKYKDHFFAADFTASPSNSLIWAVAVKPKGASFEVTKSEPFIKGMVPTDCDFGPDGAFYWSDWVGGWQPPGKGRLFRVTDPEAMKNPAVAEAKKLLAEGFEKKTTDELAKLLEHPHQQVRQEAQFELAGRVRDPDRIGEVVRVFGAVARDGKNRLARLHAIWGLGMLDAVSRGASRDKVVWVVEARQTDNYLVPLAADPDAEVRLNAVRVLGRDESTSAGFPDDPRERVGAVVRKLLSDPDGRVRAAAAVAYGRFGRHVTSVTPGSELDKYGPLFAALKVNADADPYLRHAAVMGLVEASKANDRRLWDAWTPAKKNHDTPAVRLGVVLALRRLKGDKVAEFLSDDDPKIVAEAARAIYDERLANAYPRLADFADKPAQPDPVAYRALAANYVLGTPEAAARVARYAATSAAPEHLRVFALQLLADWASPPRRDPITGLTHDLPKRPASLAADALRPVVAGVFAGPPAVRAEAAKVSAKLGIREVGPLLTALVKDANASATSRADALAALAAVRDPKLAEVVAYAKGSDVPKLRAAALTVRAEADPAAVLKDLPALLGDDQASVAEKQAAFAVLAGYGRSEAADKILADVYAGFPRGKVPPEVVLDLVEAVEARAARPGATDPVKDALAAHRKRLEGRADLLGPWVEQGLEAGGDADRGRQVFLNNSAVYCQRCHRLDGQGGDVGPAVNGIAAQPGKDRRYLLESIVFPSSKIAQGYETAVLSLADGRTVSGVVKEETKDRIKLMTPENKELVIPADEVEGRRTGPSAMPDDLHTKLSRRELRDVVEFLVALKDPAPKGGRR